jgi:hypothetical protein
MQADSTHLAGLGPDLQYTDHAMLIPWGHFARQFGLVEALMKVPLPQKTVEHAPQTKLLQLLVATLAGCAHLQDMADGSHPLVNDLAVAAAWGQPAWADPSGVSRTCQAADEQTVAATLSVLQQFSQPFIDREVLLAIRQEGRLCFDADLTGREVSATSRDYPGAAFGWMGDHIGLGYQAAVVSMRSPTYGRILLAGQRHAGDTVATECLRGLVLAAEAANGVRPQRRPELAAQRLEAVVQSIRIQEQRVASAAQQVQAAAAAMAAAEAELAGRRAVVETLIAKQRPDRQEEPERPYGELAKARARQEVYERRVVRRRDDLAQAEARLSKQREKRAALETEQAALGAHHARLIADNEANAAPVKAIFRLDAGFSSGGNLAWLIEMGYEVYTKAHNAQVTAGLLAAKPAEAPWQRVGKNAELWVQTGVLVTNCPYPLDAAVERFHTGDSIRHGTLLHYGEDAVGTDPVGWFGRYNERQTVEAGIKENKGVFQMRHLKLRSPAGLALAEAFALFAANLVRWAAVWLAESNQAAPAPFALSGGSIKVKQLVRTVANTSAWVIPQPRQGVVVAFTERSPFGGVQLVIGGNGAFQPPLPLLKSVQTPPPKTIRPMVAQ